MVDHLGDVAKPLITQGTELVANFLQGVRQGFEQFFDNIKTHLLGGLTEWLFGEKVTDFKDLPSLFLRILGVTWDQILGIVGKVIGQRNLGIIFKVVDEIGEVIDLGPAKWLENKKEELGAAFSLDELKNRGFGPVPASGSVSPRQHYRSRLHHS